MKLGLFAGLLVTLAFACGGDDTDEVVGASCVQDRDCAERCMTGGDYPGGFCTVSCRDDFDCPVDTVCADKSGGICLFDCEVSSHCDFLGPRYVCRDENNRGDGRRIGVCLGD